MLLEECLLITLRERFQLAGIVLCGLMNDIIWLILNY